MILNLKNNRVPGVIYLVLIITGVFANLYVKANLFVSGDAAATARNIIDSELFFRAGLIADLIMITSFVMLGLSIYKIFSPLFRGMARALLAFVLVGSAVLCLNVLNQFAALMILDGSAAYLQVFNPEQLEALALFFLDLKKSGYYMAHPFFGLWLFPLGYMLMKSGYLPKIVGIVLGGLLMVGCFCYLADFFVFFLFPDSYKTISAIIMIPTNLGEFGTSLWLLIVGLNTVVQGKTVQAKLETA